MADRSQIEWTDATWNPITGCTKVSPGCAHCYAEAITLRFKRGGPYLPGKATIQTHPARLGIPLKWKKPRRIFVNSVSDIFHEEVGVDFIYRIFEVMAKAEQHTFQVLTKRHERLAYLADYLPWPPNVWVGVSVENQHWAEERIPALKEVPAMIRFLSVEPLLKRVELIDHIRDGEVDWVIVGGESGPKARPMEREWVDSILIDCLTMGIPFFFKQWGGRNSKAGGRELDGRTWDMLPRPDNERFIRRVTERYPDSFVELSPDLINFLKAHDFSGVTGEPID